MNAGSPEWLSRTPDALTLTLHVQPGAAHTRVAGVHGGRLKVRVAAPASEGRANRALVRYLAREFGVPPSGVELLSGEGQRLKRVRVHRPRTLPGWLGAASPGAGDP